MGPSDNIFNIYYDIGRAVPFEVQRFPKGATDWYRNQSVLVTRIKPRGQYGEAFGFYLQGGERADSYWCSKDETEPQPIPCCGCAGWSLVRVIGEPTVKATEKKPITVLEPDDTISFGKYKGRKVIEVYLENSQYLEWAEANVKDFLVNWQALGREHWEMRKIANNEQGTKQTKTNLTDEFTTEMHWEMMEGEIDREELLAWAAYGAINRGVSKADALANYNVSEEYYDQLIGKQTKQDIVMQDCPEAVDSKQDTQATEEPFKAPDGTIYPSYEAYCNDPDLDSDIIQCKLWNGQRKPQNDFERKLLKEIEKAKAEGKVFEIYPE